MRAPEGVRGRLRACFTLTRNIDLNTKDSGGKTGFYCACSSGHVKIVELLIKNSVEYNVDLNAEDISGLPVKNPRGQEVMRRAADARRRLLICQKKGYAPPSPPHSTSLGYDWSCAKGHVKIVELLFKKFHSACSSGQVKVVKFLIINSVECNIDLNAKESGDRTGFLCACSTGQVKVVELLVKNSVECNIDLNAKDKYEGKTGFHYACSSGNQAWW